jgi:regulator of sigma E protease
MSLLLTYLLYAVGIAGMFLLLIGPHEAGHFLFAKLFKVGVIEFSIGAGPRLWSVTRDGTLYAIRLIPVLGYVRMSGMDAGDLEDPNGFQSKPAWQRIVILLGGPVANFLVAMLLITGALLTQVNTDAGKVGSVLPGTPAAAAGFQAGDSIRTVNGKPYVNPGLIQQEEAAAPGSPLILAGVHSNGQPFTVTVTPICDPKCHIGVSLPPKLLSTQMAVSEGLAFPFTTIAGISKAMWSLITGEVPGGLLGPGGLTGPIGIADVAVQAIDRGPLFYVFLVALLSVAVGFTNLLPVLALDGGRILVVVIEWIRRRPFDRNAEMNFQRWGLVALIALAAVISVLDVQRIATGQFPGLK